MEKNPIKRLRSLALNFKNIGSIASTQKELMELADEIEELHTGDSTEVERVLNDLTELYEKNQSLTLELQKDAEQIKLMEDKEIKVQKQLKDKKFVRDLLQSLPGN